MVAFDLLPDLIAVAHRRLAGRRNVDLLVADMRSSAIAMRLGRRFDLRFDLVVAVDDPFVHLTKEEDRERAFAAAAGLVAPGGRFLLDAAWFPPGQRQAAGRPGGLVLERSGRGALQVREIWRCDPETRLCEARFEYRLEGREVEHASFPARLWSSEELEQHAGAAGLAVIHLWGDYDRRPWDRETSSRLIAEMRRVGELPGDT